MEMIGETMQVMGEVMIGLTAIMVHHRMWKEHKIDEAVYGEMQKEQWYGFIGISLVVIGFTIRLVHYWHYI